MAKSKTLYSLNLDWNKVGSEGAVALAKNKTITELNILQGNVKIDDKAASALVKNTTLLKLPVTLYLSVVFNNRVSREYKEAIIQQIKNNKEKYLSDLLKITQDIVRQDVPVLTTILEYACPLYTLEDKNRLMNSFYRNKSSGAINNFNSSSLSQIGFFPSPKKADTPLGNTQVQQEHDVEHYPVLPAMNSN